MLTLTELSSAREEKTNDNSQCGTRETMGSFLLLFADNKITQWEDPRLQNPAITGPVSTAVGSSLQCPEWGTAGAAAGRGSLASRSSAAPHLSQKRLAMPHQVLGSLPACSGIGDAYGEVLLFTMGHS